MGLIDERNHRRLPSHPLGMNNTTPENQPPTDERGVPVAVRDALNVDFTAAGKFRRRQGHSLELALSGAHSLFADDEFPFLMVRDGDALYALDQELAPEQVLDGLGDGETSYCELNGELLWTIEGRACGRVDSLLANRPLAVPTPDAPRLSAGSGGGLAAGTYRVQLTFIDEHGEEGGASEPAEIVLPDNGAISVAVPPRPATITGVRVWATAADGSEPLHAASAPASVDTVLVEAGPRGDALATADLSPLPPGQLVRELNGIVLMAVDNFLLYGTAMRPRLTQPDHFVPFKARVDMVQVVGQAGDAGVFVAAGKRVYYLSGPTPKQFSVRMVRTAGAVPGTGLSVPAEAVGVEAVGHVAYWMGSDGTPCLGLPGGAVRPLAKGVAMTRFDRGASLLREVNGLTQLLTAGPQGPLGAIATADTVEVFQYRDGQLIP